MRREKKKYKRLPVVHAHCSEHKRPFVRGSSRVCHDTYRIIWNRVRENTLAFISEIKEKYDPNLKFRERIFSTPKYVALHAYHAAISERYFEENAIVEGIVMLRNLHTSKVIKP